MAWTINYLKSVRKKANKISPVDRQRIRKFLEEHLANLDNPRSLGKRLVGKEEIWRYRLGNYRVLCEIQDLEITILVIDMGHISVIAEITHGKINCLFTPPGQTLLSRIPAHREKNHLKGPN